MSNKKTEIVCVLDRSGSMGSIIDDAIEGFNTFLKEQKKIEGEASITIALFDHEYQLLKDNVDIKKVKKLTSDDWMPRGTTALYDAIGKTILTVKERHKKIKKDNRPNVIFCIVTDGMENDSKEFDNKTINKLIDKQKKKKWGFIYLAANQDAFAVGSTMGLTRGATLTYTPDKHGVSFYSSTLSKSVASYRNAVMSDDDIDVDKLIKTDDDKDNKNN